MNKHIVKSLITAAQQVIPFTQPYSEPSRTHPRWNDFVKSFQSEALDWHSIWIRSGRPQSGFVYDMPYVLNVVDFVIKRDNKIKGRKIADNYLISDSRDFWEEAEKLRRRNNCQLLL